MGWLVLLLLVLPQPVNFGDQSGLQGRDRCVLSAAAALANYSLA